MTRISFFHGAADRLQAAADWLARGSGPQRRVVVYAPRAEDLDRLDKMLWINPATGFVPHCRSTSPLAPETSITLAESLDDTPHDDCLLNLSHQVPPGFSRFEHLVEIVSTAEDDRLQGRERFRFYRERGYPLDAHDVAGGLP